MRPEYSCEPEKKLQCCWETYVDYEPDKVKPCGRMLDAINDKKIANVFISNVDGRRNVLTTVYY